MNDKLKYNLMIKLPKKKCPLYKNEIMSLTVCVWISYSAYDDISGRATVTTRLERSSTIGLPLALTALDADVILLGVHGGEFVDGLVDCAALTPLANKTPSYCTPFNSIETTNCCSPVSELPVNILISKYVKSQ